MCGIVSVIVKNRFGFTQKEIDAFGQLLFADQLRGKDGTGIFYNGKKGKAHVRTLKAPYHSSIFVNTKEYSDVEKILFQESNFIVGHNRAATRGKVALENTHPFREKHITLVHNGTLTTQKELDEEVEVDSHAICCSMANRGEKETLKLINGAFALIWFNSQTKMLNMCRNSQRPLHLIETASCFIACSELELGLWIATRNNMTITKSFALVPEKLYSFDLDDMSTYLEEDVEYKKFYNPPTTQATTYLKQGDSPWLPNLAVTKHFSFGQKVRFKGGFIRQNKAGSFLEGDILKFQKLPLSYTHVKGDWEDQWRLKIYGLEKDLLPFAQEKELIGTIKHSVIQGQLITFVVGDIAIYEEAPRKADVFNIGKKEEPLCEWCGGDMPKANQMQGYTVCDSCAEPLLFGHC